MSNPHAAPATDDGILVLSSPLPHEPFVEALRRAAGPIPVWTEHEVPDPARVQAILAWRMKPGVLPRYPRLKLLCSTGAGVDKLLAPDLPEHLPVTRTVDPGQGMEMAQYAVACTLAHTRQLDLYSQLQARSAWERHPVRERAQCRIGILGFGAVGQSIARAFAPLGYPVHGHCRQPRRHGEFQTFAGSAGLPAFLAQTDVLVCTLPLTGETRGCLNRRTLSQLPRGAYLINLGRGEQLVEPDLRALLDEGHLAGAALDVFEREPVPIDHWVWHHPKLRVTPHIAAQASFDVVAAQCLASLAEVRAGRQPALAIDRRAGY